MLCSIIHTSSIIIGGKVSALIPNKNIFDFDKFNFGFLIFLVLRIGFYFFVYLFFSIDDVFHLILPILLIVFVGV